MKTVIIAAGWGSRLWPTTDQTPKTLLPFGGRRGGGTMLSQIMTNFAAAGSSEFVVVVGFQAELVVTYLRTGLGGGSPSRYPVEVVENPEWRRGNGVSVCAARRAVGDGPFLLSMSDHLVSPVGLQAMVGAPGGANLLLVDHRIDAVPDLDDATKVRMDGSRILEIGKDLAAFNAIDCGVFRLDGRFFEAMERQAHEGKESISEGARELIRQSAFEGVPMPKNGAWVDVDTPDAYRFALAHADRFA
ncbi:MAG: sugar phosphate nucleotidyltransferase [Gemmatimonadales bacterium]